MASSCFLNLPLKSLGAATKASASNAALFPELSVTGYSCADLFQQDRLLVAAEDALCSLAAAAGALPAYTDCLALYASLREGL